MEINIVTQLHNSALKFADKKALSFLNSTSEEVESLTYGELYNKALELSQYLSKNKVEKGDRVILIYPPGINFFIGFYACTLIGAIAVPVIPPFNKAQKLKLKNIIRDCQPKFILPSIMDLTLSQFTKFQTLKSFFKIFSKKSNLKHLTQEALNNINNDDIVFIQYTSGSTGHPKGVIVRHRNLLANIQQIHAVFKKDCDHIGASWLPPYHDMGLIGSLLFTIYYGIPIIFVSPIDFLRKPLKFLKILSDNKVTLSAMPTFGLSYILHNFNEKACKGLDLSHLEHLIIGAEPIAYEVLQEFQKVFSPYGLKESTYTPSYGLAEATLIVSGKVNSGKFHRIAIDKIKLKNHIVEITDENSINAEKFVSCGEAVPGVEILIVNPTTEELATPGTVGEIWILGPNITSGYWQNPELNSEVFRKIAHQDNEKLYLRTGDLGFLHEDELYICGRIKELILIRGENHYPHDIEYTVFETSNLIKPGGVVASSYAEQTSAKLAILCEIYPETTEEEYAPLCQKISNAISINHQVIPDTIFLLPPKSLPKTTSGKLRRQYALELAQDKKINILYQHEAQIPRTLIEENLSSSKQSLLNKAHSPINLTNEEIQEILSDTLMSISNSGFKIKLDLNSSIEKLGLDSIEVISFINKIEKVFNIELGASELLHTSSMQDLVKKISDLKKLSKNPEKKALSEVTKTKSPSKRLAALSPRLIWKWVIETIHWSKITLKYHFSNPVSSILLKTPSKIIRALTSMQAFFKASLSKDVRIAKKAIQNEVMHFQLMTYSNDHYKFYFPEKYFPYTFEKLDRFFKTCQTPSMMLFFHMIGWPNLMIILFMALKNNPTVKITILENFGPTATSKFELILKELEFIYGVESQNLSLSTQINLINVNEKKAALQILEAIKEKRIILTFVEPNLNYDYRSSSITIPLFSHHILISKGIFDIAFQFQLPTVMVEQNFSNYQICLNFHRSLPPLKNQGESLDEFILTSISPLLRRIYRSPHMWYGWFYKDLLKSLPKTKWPALSESKGKVINRKFHFIIDMKHYVLIFNLMNQRIVQFNRADFQMLKKLAYPINRDSVYHQLSQEIPREEFDNALDILLGK